MKSSKRKRTRETVVSTTSDVDELTIAEAATLLHVSRTYLDTLLAAGKLPGIHETREGDRRIPRAEVLAFKERLVITQKRGLKRMMEASQRMGLYDAEIGERRFGRKQRR
jgi:excisionase family DNA binding protein